MLDPRFVRENPGLVKEAARKKRLEVDVDRWMELDASWRQLQSRWEELRAEQKSAGKSIGSLSGSDKERALEELTRLKSELKDLEAQLPEMAQERDALADRFPSIPSEEVPDGEDDQENAELYKIGDPPTFAFEPLDHVELCQRHDLVDFERASRIAGSRTFFLKNEGALLDLAIQRLAIDVGRERGFSPMLPPVVVRREAMYGTAYFPGGEDQAYAIPRDEAWLVGTSEVPLTSFHGGEILDEKDLPKRYLGISPCFRREAGAAGKDTRGLYRIHQFNKVEQVVVGIHDEAQSVVHHKEILANAEHLLGLLELPYRVVNVCGGDLGQGQVQKYDIETWMPSRDAYGETHSASRFHDFQARRLNLRYRDKDGKVHFCHTLNNTLIATPRVLIPLLEVHQREDGSIRIPEALVPYCGFETIG